MIANTVLAMHYKSMFVWHNADTVESSNISMVMIAISEAVGRDTTLHRIVIVIASLATYLHTAPFMRQYS